VLFLAVTALIALLALVEYNRLTAGEGRDKLFDIWTVFGGFLIFAALYWCEEPVALPVLIGILFSLFLSGLLGGRTPKKLFGDAAVRICGVVYICLPFSLLIPLRGLAQGRWWVFFLVVIIWVNDSGAYITGRLVGRHKLSPVISPNKSIEGAVGGVLSGVAAAFIMNAYIGLELGPLTLTLLAVSMGLVAIAGDLIESVIKRAVGAKDSGSIIPGHGGMLDRIDSLIFTIPLLYYFLIWQF
jgi:phosphatidate cytidylyltransferase